MPKDDGRAADIEARNQYLGIIDDAWEVYREAVERAWEAYETALAPARGIFDSAQAAAEAAHGKSIDDAWAAYKESVANAPTTTRRDVVAQARAHYNETAARIGKTNK